MLDTPSSNKKLERTISLLNAVIESTADGLLVVDQEGKIARFNQKFVQMWSIPDSILATRDDDQTINFVLNQLKCPENFVANVKEIYSQQDAVTHDTLEFKDGRIFERYSQPQKHGDEYLGRVWSFRDVTKFGKLVRLQNDFLSVAAHELKTPLTALKMQVQLLHRLLADETISDHPKIGGIIDALGGSEKQLDQFTMLVDDLLNVSNMHSGALPLNLERTDLSDVVRSVVERYQSRLLEVGCSIKVQADTPVNGHWDPVRLEQVVVNLLTNVMKYGAGKPVEIEVQLAISKIAKLTVRDHGIGIAKEDQQRIFERFERAGSPKDYRGFGLGLFITRQLVEAHGGTIRVESEPGKGSTFSVELPIRDPAN